MQRLFAPLVFLLVIASLFFIVYAWQNQSVTKQQAKQEGILKPFAIDEAIPEAPVKNGSGETVSLKSELGTDKHLVTFWNSFCTECKTGLNELQRFVDKNQTFPVILVNHKNLSQDALDYLADNDIRLTNYLDAEGVAYNAWSSTMPSSFWVDGGRIKYFFPGRINEDHLKALLKE